MQRSLAILIILFVPFTQKSYADEIRIPTIEVRDENIADSSVMEVISEVTGPPKDLAHTLQELPNFSRSGGSNRQRFFQIRGLGDREQFEHAQVSAVGVFYEGIDLSEEASTLPLFGGESVQARYGPQTQAWGSKAIAGSFEVGSCLTSKDCRRNIKIEAQEYNTVAGTVTLRNPSGSERKYFLNLGYLKSDGPYQNQFYDKPTHTRDEAEFVGGGSYSFAGQTITHHHLFARHNNGYDAWNFDQSFRTLSDHPGKDRHQVHGHSINWESPTPSGHLHSLLSTTFTQQLESYDEDWGNNTYWRQIPGWNADYNYFSEFDRHRFKLHQKLFHVFNSGFELGIHFYQYREKQITRAYQDELIRRFAETELRSLNTALFAAQKGSLSNTDWKLSVRGEYQDVRMNAGEDSQRSFSLWGADFKTDTALTPVLALGFLLQRGYRGGSFNTDFTLPQERRVFGAENVINSEVSAQWNPGFYLFSAKVFGYRYEDQQVKTSTQLDPTDPSSYLYYTSNVGRSRAYGAELTAQKNWAHIKVTANVGVLETEIEESPTRAELRGRGFSDSPRWNSSFKAEYFREHWSFYSEYKVWGRSFYSLDHELEARSVSMLDLGFKYRLGEWELSLWATNVLSESYGTRAYYFANEPPNWEERLYLQNGEPRNLGAILVYYF